MINIKDFENGKHLVNYMLKIFKNLDVDIPKDHLEEIKKMSKIYEFIQTQINIVECPICSTWTFDNWIKHAQNGEYRDLSSISKRGNEYIKEFIESKNVSFNAVFNSFGLDMKYRSGYLETKPRVDDIYYPHKLGVWNTSKYFKTHQLFYYSNPKNELTTNIGCYFIYDKYNQNEIVYIGKSNSDLLNRACQSARERTSGMFSKIKLIEMNTHADTNIYELYYIAKYKPKYNTDSTCEDYPTNDLPEISKNYYIELVGEKEFVIEHLDLKSKYISKEEFWSDEKYLLDNERNKQLLLENELKSAEGYDEYMRLKDELDAKGFLTFSNYFNTKNMEENNK